MSAIQSQSLWRSIDPPAWWRARCRVAVVDVLIVHELASPRAIRGALRKTIHELWQDGAPTYRRKIWHRVVRVALGSMQRKMRDRRQLELFS